MRPHHVRALLRRPDFVRLFAVRLSGQFGDGVFQASLAGAVLFNPERQASAVDVAAGFAVLLLPYSLIGPFPGVLLDRWPRRDLLFRANVGRAVAALVMAAAIAAGVSGLPFYAGALVVLSISRFFLAGLSASLPHVVDARALVTANALSTTSGGVATTLGGAAAIALRLVSGDRANLTYAALAACAALPYLASAVTCRRFQHRQLGPDETERAAADTPGDVLSGLLGAARHLRRRRAALQALTAIGVQRLCYGLFAVMTVLLFRNHYTAVGPARTGLAGLSEFLVLGGLGAAAAAAVVPAVARRRGVVSVAVGLLTVSAVTCLLLVLPLRLPAHLAAGLVLGFASQGIKVCVDTQVQRTVADEYRGRVFALYDAAFNVALVVAASAAILLPADGASRPAVIVIVIGFQLTAVVWWVADRRLHPGPSSPAVRPPGAVTGQPLG